MFKVNNKNTRTTSCQTHSNNSSAFASAFLLSSFDTCACKIQQSITFLKDLEDTLIQLRAFFKNFAKTALKMDDLNTLKRRKKKKEGHKHVMG